MTPQPGDFGLVSIKGGVGWLIRIGQFLNGDGFRRYEHAFIFVGDGLVVEAEPGGATISEIGSYADRHIMWSTGLIPLTDSQRTIIIQKALEQVGTPYSFLDYLAIAMYRLGIKYPGVAKRVKDSRHLICSQLVATDYAFAGVALTKYPPYLVTPGKLVKYLISIMNTNKTAKQIQQSGNDSINIQASGDINIASI